MVMLVILTSIDKKTVSLKLRLYFRKPHDYRQIRDKGAGKAQKGAFSLQGDHLYPVALVFRRPFEEVTPIHFIY